MTGRSWIARIALAVAFLLGSLAAGQLALPGGTFACSCAAPEPGAPLFTGEEQAVFIGTALQPQPDGTFRFAVERWFVGGNAHEINVTSERQPMGDGAMVIDSCGLHFEVGDRMILSAGVDRNVYRPALCSPHAAMNTDEGAAMLRAAVATFGQGSAPAEAPDPRDTMPDDPDLAGLAIGGVGTLLLVVVIAVIASARQRRDEDPAA